VAYSLNTTLVAKANTRRTRKICKIWQKGNGNNAMRKKNNHRAN
jgi:hypothetical protein